MSSTTRRPRAIAAVVTALTLCLSAPLVAHADTDDLPVLPDPHSTPSLFPRDDAPSSRFRPVVPEVPVAESPAETRSGGTRPFAAAAAPGVVRDLTAVEVLSTRAQIAWTAPADGGSRITGYRLQLLQDGSVIDDVVWPKPALGTTILDLTPDATYTFRVAAVNAIGTGELSAPIEFTAAHSSVERLFGADRYETAAAVSADAFPEAGVITAFVASGLDFPDALSAAAAAGLMRGPVLLTKPGSLPAATAREVAALKLISIFVTGGPAAVSETVLSRLTPLTTEGAFRFGGKNRYETAAAMSSWWDLEFPDVVYLASGADYPDALAGAAAAGFLDSPILLTGTDALPAETAAALTEFAPEKVIALGGPGSLSDSVLESARLATGVETVAERLGGSTRYDTAVAVSRDTFAAPRVPVVYVASGEDFADALAGAGAGGGLGGPVLLTPPAEIPAAVLAEIRRLDPARVIVLGGPSVVSETVSAQIADALG